MALRFGVMAGGNVIRDEDAVALLDPRQGWRLVLQTPCNQGNLARSNHGGGDDIQRRMRSQVVPLRPQALCQVDDVSLVNNRRERPPRCRFACVEIQGPN